MEFRGAANKRTVSLYSPTIECKCETTDRSASVVPEKRHVVMILEDGL